MKLQQLIKESELDLSIGQIKGFFLGTLMASKPLAFPQILEELLGEDPQGLKELSAELKLLWEQTKTNLSVEKQKFLDSDLGPVDYLTEAQSKLDYFLTALALGGTHADSVDEDTADLLEDLEEALEDADDLLSEEVIDEDEAEGLKDYLKETWQDLLEKLKSPTK